MTQLKPKLKPNSNSNPNQRAGQTLAKQVPAPLLKQKSWSPDTLREEVWLRRKQQRADRRKSKSLTDDDFDELKACIELGFGFDSPGLETNERLSSTLPALGFYVAVHKSYTESMSRMSSSSSLGTTLSASENDLVSLDSPAGSPLFAPGEDPKTIKTRLRQWAQAVACSVKQS